MSRPDFQSFKKVFQPMEIATMGPTKQYLLEQMELDQPIAIEKFMRANGVTVVGQPTGFGSIEIEVEGTRIQGRLAITLSWTREEAITFLGVCGIPVQNKYTGD